MKTAVFGVVIPILILSVLLSACPRRSESTSRTPGPGKPGGPAGPTARPAPGPLPKAAAPRFDLLDKLSPSHLAVRYPEGLTDHDSKIISVHCPFGRPTANPTANHGETVFVIRKGYALLHSSKRKTALWVCEAVGKKQLSGSATRQGIRIKPDERLLQYPRAELKDYKKSGYHRGRLASCGNQAADPKRLVERLMLSNTAPMKPRFRTGVWRALEEKVRAWVKARGYARVITGPMMYAEEGGQADYLFIGPGKVIVPTHFYKIVVAPDARGRWQAIGFVLANRPYDKPYDWASFIKPIDWIEKHAGFDFMPNLSPAQQARFERRPAKMG